MTPPFSEKELVIWFKLSNVKGLGPVKLLKLFSIFNTLEGLYNATDSELLKTRVFNEKRLFEWGKLKDASDENFKKPVQECVKNKILVMPLVDTEYPAQLLNIPYPPLTLFLKGDISLFRSELIAMVGTRNADSSALQWTYKTAKELSDKGLTIVSGGALGIDTAAHEGALASPHGKTICVLGAGLLKPYPEKNLELFSRIGERGLLVSEHLPTFPGSRIALIQRNRITSGLSTAIILCASKSTGGAMIQTKIAHEQRVPILYPSLNLNLLPNEGLKFAKEYYHAHEISSTDEVVTFLQQINKHNGTQQTL